MGLARGKVVLLLKTTYTVGIIKDGKNGFLYESDSDLLAKLRKINSLSDAGKSAIGLEARKTALSLANNAIFAEKLCNRLLK